MKDNLREIAYFLFSDVMEKQKYLHIEMNRTLEKYDYLGRKEKAFIRRLCTGAVEHCISIDAYINAVSTLKVKKFKPQIRTILRLSVYQIVYMDAVADAVAVESAVELARKFKFNNLTGFVNGVLRNISRKKNEISIEKLQRLEITSDIYELLDSQYPGKAADICSSYLEHSNKGTAIRLNRSRIDNETEYLNAIGAEIVCDSLGGAIIKNMGSPYEIDGFLEGKFIFQDLASSLPVYMSDAKKTDRILELCAAPGGKTIQLLDITENEAYVDCRDISSARCDMIKEAVNRCGFSNIRILNEDARNIKEEDIKSFDICLVDAPCSGLGVIGSKPDIRFHYNKAQLSDLRKLQEEILYSGIKAVKKGGILVYSTCTLDRRENEILLGKAMKQRKSSIIDISQKLPDCFKNFENNKGMITIFPQKGLCEGFFVGVLRIEE